MIQKPQRRSFFRSPWLWTILALVLIVAFAAFVRPAASVESEVAVDGLIQTTQVALGDVENKTISQPEAPETASHTTRIAEKATGKTLVADTPSSDNCIACHTDEEKLQELAEEPEEVHSEEAGGEG